jgi:hypothetical protein
MACRFALFRAGARALLPARPPPCIPDPDRIPRARVPAPRTGAGRPGDTWGCLSVFERKWRKLGSLDWLLKAAPVAAVYDRRNQRDEFSAGFGRFDELTAGDPALQNGAHRAPLQNTFSAQDSSHAAARAARASLPSQQSDWLTATSGWSFIQSVLAAIIGSGATRQMAPARRSVCPGWDRCRR